jgi:hypothetical protein
VRSLSFEAYFESGQTCQQYFSYVMAISEWTFYSFSLSLKLYIYSETLKFYIHEIESDICIGYELEMNNDR